MASYLFFLLFLIISIFLFLVVIKMNKMETKGINLYDMIYMKWYKNSLIFMFHYAIYFYQS